MQRATRHLALIATTTLLGLAGPAAPARADEVRDTQGGVTATLSWENRELPEGDLNIRLRVERAGTVVADAVPVAPGEEFLSIVSLPGVDPPPLAVSNLDADGPPEILVTTFSGGAYCCWATRVFRGPGYTEAPEEFGFGESGWRLGDLGRGPAADLTLGAPAYHYVPVSHAASGYPLVVLNYDNGRFIDVSRRFKHRLERDARGWRRAWRRFKRGNDEARGALSAYVVDLERLGRTQRAEAAIQEAGRKEQLPEGTRAFRRDIRKLMRALRGGRASPFAHQNVP